MLITVFTPTYNRAKLLPRLHKSLQEQTKKNFEWLIVDDGSTDNTKKIIETTIEKNKDKFPIRYFYKQNGGKHTAINYGVKKAKGELFLILDSDDSLPNYSLENIQNAYKKGKEKENFGGVCGLMGHHNGNRIGCGFPTKVLYANTIELRYKFHITGDLSEVFRTRVLKENPFPEIIGEKFCPEILLWNRIAKKYKLYCFSDIIYFRDYLDGGLTDRIVEIRMKSPITSMMCYAEMLDLNIPFKDKIKAAINYWRFRLCYNGNSSYPKIPGLWNAVAPLGWLMHLKDKRVNKR